MDPAPIGALDHPSVVVALVDSGINPYHEAFRAPGLQLPSAISAIAEPVRLSFDGTFEDNQAEDAAFWDAVEWGRLYWFEDTRILAVTLQEETISERILDWTFHGTATAGAVVHQSPEGLILMVQSGSERRDLPPFFDAQATASAIATTVAFPWVDVVSISLGFPAGVPLEGFESIPPATLEATRAGKIVVAGTGNDGLPSISNQIGGPPWVVRAGGVDPSQGGEVALASRAPDYVSDYVGMLPCADSVTEYCEFMGTSLSTPLIAGAYAQAILDLRRAANHTGGITADGALVDANGLRFTNLDLRAAFNATASYWATTDYAPQVPPLGGNPFLIPFRVAAPVAPTPWVQMGWGYIGNETGPEVARGLLTGALPIKAPEAVAYMGLAMQAREAYWDQQD